MLVKGVAFKKSFSYAGFEQQPKTFKNPKILCLNIELELKAEKDNAEVRVEQVSVRKNLCLINIRNIKQSSTQNGKSSSKNSKPSLPPVPK
jgi:chaperonin GroEL (HSP60 family)